VHFWELIPWSIFLTKNLLMESKVWVNSGFTTCANIVLFYLIMNRLEMLLRFFFGFIFQLLLHVTQVSGHHDWALRHSESSMKEFSSRFGVVVSFEKPVYLNGFFQPFDGWDSINQHFGAENVSYIVRVEFELSSFKENKIKRRFKLFW